ncbi:MAG TPA: hypothetical protein VEH27_07290 [Methylomirabilota bacterium]|nr:hypothetical protein [Methylomirabilota bacterium]
MIALPPLFAACLALACLLLPPTLAATPRGPGLRAAPFSVSSSGQFRVRLQQQEEIREPMRDGEVYLEVSFVAVSAERVKKALLRELKLADQFQGKIHLAISPARSSHEIIPVVASLQRDGWQYAVELPQRIGEIAFVRAITHALLLEIANRHSQTRSAEIPLWLGEGLAQKLLYEVGGGFLMKPETYVDQTKIRFDPGFFFRELKPGLKLMNFSELSSTSATQLTNEAVQRFIATTVVFVSELLEIQNGAERLVTTLQNLPHRWNWQTAFLEGFHPHFRTLLDVEKWWSVSLTDLASHQTRLATASESVLDPLEALLTATLQQRSTTNALPDERTVTLQEFIRETEFSAQREVLRQKIAQLVALQFRSRAEVMNLSDRYRAALEAYFEARDTTQPVGSLRLPAPAQGRAAVEKVLRELDALDGDRKKLRQQFADISSPNIDPRVRDPRRQR